MKPTHPAADLFPMMADDEFDALCEDIKANGQREPVWLDKTGRILDGRNRAKACEVIGKIPNYRTWDGEGSPVNFVLSLNLHRRHLSASQKGVVALKVERLEAEEARKRMARAGASAAPGRPAEKGVEIVPPLSEPKGKARDRAAAAVGANPRYVQDAKFVEAKAPDLLPQIESGAMTLPEAKKHIRQQEKAEKVAEIASREPAPIDATGTFSLLYVDPPWRYDFAESSTRTIENHYPTMSLDDIKAMEVPADDDAVLFLWATSPKLDGAMEVIEAWGFNYVTCAVWVKDKIGMGYYFRQQHELLLVAKRGSLPVPDPEDRPSSVVSGVRTEHSAKPDAVYELIERMYPTLERKVELFARRPRDGWAAWGNQADAA